MMALRIYWGTRTRRCVAGLVMTASLVAPLVALAKDDKPVERVTAREAMERQFAAPSPERASTMNAAEAAAIMKKYHARIGVMLEPKREIGGRADK